MKPTLQGNRRIGEALIGRGIACWVDGTIGAPSYAARDAGKPGTPGMNGPCAGIDYYVLNGWGENYSPTDNLGHTTSVGLSEGTFKSTPRPWMTNRPQ